MTLGCDVTGILLGIGNHPQVAASFSYRQVRESVEQYNSARWNPWSWKHGDEPSNLEGSLGDIMLFSDEAIRIVHSKQCSRAVW